MAHDEQIPLLYPCNWAAQQRGIRPFTTLDLMIGKVCCLMLRLVRADYDIMLITIIACSYTNLPQFAFKCTAAPLWCGLGCCSQTGVVYKSTAIKRLYIALYANTINKLSSLLLQQQLTTWKWLQQHLPTWSVGPVDFPNPKQVDESTRSTAAHWAQQPIRSCGRIHAVHNICCLCSWLKPHIYT